MVLSVEQARELLKAPKYIAALQDAVNHENQVKLHSKPVHSVTKASPYYREFLEWVEKGIGLPPDKFRTFGAMLRFPVATNELVDTIYTEYERMFSASDANTEITIPEPTLRADFAAFLASIDIRNYFRTEGFKTYKTQPNSVYVVDLPAMQVSQRPEPYFYRVGIQMIRDINVSKGVINYIIFETEKDIFVQIDAQFYRVFQKITSADGKPDYRLQAQSEHRLGYCPATFMIHDALYDLEDNSPIARKTPISASLGDLDWLLFYKTGERMYETYGPFPIMTVPEFQCDFTDAVSGQMCESGIVKTLDDSGQLTKFYKCPACAQNSLVGAGTVFTKQIRRSKEDPESESPVEITPPDIDSLKFITEKIDYLEWEIYENTVGANDDTAVKEAVNDKQVQSNAEGKRNVLMKIKRDFELTEKFIIDTMGRLRYDVFYTPCTVNYGEDFLLYTEADLITQYTNVKKAGLPTFMVNEKKQKLILSATRKNNYAAQRMKILDDLEPWVNMSLQECQQYQYDQMYPDKFLLKADFAKFVSRFEGEYADVVQYLSGVDYQTKLDSIQSKIEEYVREERAKAKPVIDPTRGGQGGNTPGATQAGGGVQSGGE